MAADAGGGEATSTEKKTITVVWSPLEPKYKAAFEKYYFEPYTKAHPDVVIDFQPMQDVWNIVRVQVSAGVGPDIFTTDGFEIPYYAEAGRIANLQSYADKYNWKDRIYPWALNSAKYNNQVFALPHSSEVSGLFANESMLKQFGLKVPTTREEFVAACKRAMAERKIAISFSNQNRLHNQWLYEHYLTATVGAKGVADLFQGRARLTDSGYRRAFQMLKEDWDAGFLQDKQVAALTLDESRNQFRTGAALFEPEGTWLTMEGIEAGTWEIDWSLNPWPTFNPALEPAGAIAVGAFFAVNNNTKYKDICAEILNGIYADAAWVAQSIGDGGLQTLCTDIDTSLLPSTTPNDVIESLEAINKIASLSGVSYAPWSVYPAKTNDFLMDNFMRMLTGEFTIDQYCQGAQAVLDTEIADGFSFTSYN